MGETTLKQRDEIRGWLVESAVDAETNRAIAACVRDADLLARYESQCIARDADIPADAIAWVKNTYEHGARHECFFIRAPTSESSDDGWHVIAGAAVEPNAPDYSPGTPGPLYRHIVDVE